MNCVTRVLPESRATAAYNAIMEFEKLADVGSIGAALTGEPSWNFTPERSLKTHLVVSLSSTFHSVARPGIRTLALSAEERSQCVSASNSGIPVKRLPSKP